MINSKAYGCVLKISGRIHELFLDSISQKIFWQWFIFDTQNTVLYTEGRRNILRICKRFYFIDCMKRRSI